MNPLSYNSRNYFENNKITKMHPDLPSFFGATSYTGFTMTNLGKKYMWKAWKILLVSLLLPRDHCKKHMVILYEKYPTSLNWYFSMTSSDFQGLFQAKWHFCRPASSSMTFQSKTLIPWLFQAFNTNHYPLSPKLLGLTSFWTPWMAPRALRNPWDWNLQTETKYIP